MRELSDKFMDDLIKPDGILHPILQRVRKDQTLMLAIRDSFINIYYRGGNLLQVKVDRSGIYRTFFDEAYNISGQTIPSLPAVITEQGDARKWVETFQFLKNIMDENFTASGNAEREFQQLVARENNCSSISNESEYFISDIEVSVPETHARFDMVAIQWKANKRRSGNNCRAAFIEMKYGDGSLGGNAGMLKHLKDIDAFIADKEKYEHLIDTIQRQFNQLDQLGLLNFKKGKSFARVQLDPNEPPEVIFILANHNPRASKLRNILSCDEIKPYSDSRRFELKFFVSSYAGYGLHTECMKTLGQFLNTNP